MKRKVKENETGDKKTGTDRQSYGCEIMKEGLAKEDEQVFIKGKREAIILYPFCVHQCHNTDIEVLLLKNKTEHTPI